MAHLTSEMVSEGRVSISNWSFISGQTVWIRINDAQILGAGLVGHLSSQICASHAPCLNSRNGRSLTTRTMAAGPTVNGFCGLSADNIKAASHPASSNQLWLWANQRFVALGQSALARATNRWAKLDGYLLLRRP